MQICATFESLEEMRGFAAEVAGMEQPKPDRQKEENPPSEKKEEAVQKEQLPAEEEEQAPQEEKDYTLVDVRGKLGALTKEGKKAQVQELIKSFGVDKLSQIPEDKYQEVMQKAGEL